MEIRYLGFDQKQNFRVYRFDVCNAGRPVKEVLVSTDVAVFRSYRIGIQEGPFLSGNKLIADLERGWDGVHELTAADVRAYADARALAAARRSGTGKASTAPAKSQVRHDLHRAEEVDRAH